MILRSSGHAMRAAILAFIVSLVFALGEMCAIYILGYSSIVVADMIHSFLDAVMSLAAAFSIYIVYRGRRSPRFPWGLYKAESLTSLFIASITLFFIIETVYRGFVEPVMTPMYAIPLLLLGFIASYSMYLYEKKWALRSISSSLTADAMHARSDAFLTLSALAGVTMEHITGSLIPQIVVLVLLASFIVKDSIHIIKESILSLLDATPQQEKVEELVRLAKAYSGLEVHRTMLKRAGSFITGVIVLEASPSLTIGEAHRIANRVRRKIYRERPDVVNLIIVIKPKERIDIEAIERELERTKPLPILNNKDSSI
ncbi:MAG: cation diffusion facilitator family transporter [Desulfurococcales archaeon]|nr:cation diffusion facilitator family transporter [Desulfurococcales archaeon]